MTDKTFNFGTDLASRMEQLLNNQYLSDVSFKVGKAGEVMVAHKSVLTVASEVFFAQLSGNFAEAKNDQPIELPDMEPPVFLEILRYMYCDMVYLKDENLVDLYYGAQKYLLMGLVKMCEDFLTDGSMNATNALRIFDDNRQHEFPKVNELCLAMILEDPLVFFEQRTFLNLQERTVELIIQSPTINCTEGQLRKTIQEWIDANEPSDKVKLPDQSVRAMQCRRLSFFSAFGYTKDMKTEAKFTFDKTVSLYGVGIFIGANKWTGNLEKVTVSVDIETDSAARRVSETLPIERDLRVCELIFGKVKIPLNIQCTLTVAMKSQGLDMFYLESMTPADCLKEMNLRVSSYSVNGTGTSYKYTHIAYFLYNIHD